MLCQVLRCFPLWAEEFFPEAAATPELPSFKEEELTGSVVVFVQDNAA